MCSKVYRGRNGGCGCPWLGARDAPSGENAVMAVTAESHLESRVFCCGCSRAHGWNAVWGE